MLRDSRVLVTGADGFIGSHLTELLARLGSRVTALSLYNSFNQWGWLDDLPSFENVRIVSGDVRDPHFCLALTQGIDIVFHLAALIPIPYSYRAPDSYVETNVKGTLNILQAARANSIKRFIHTSTSEVYGTARYTPIDENHPLTPQSPYSASKIAADCMALSFHYSFEFPVVVARPFNTYGPRQSARAIIPTIISQIAAGAEQIRIGELSTTRDFTYVEDTCRGLIAIASMEGGLGDVFNIGSNNEISIHDLLLVIGEVMRRPVVPVVEEERKRPGLSEVRRLRCDNGKLRLSTGFSPGVSLRDGLERTAKWFLEEKNRRRYKSDIYNV